MNKKIVAVLCALSLVFSQTAVMSVTAKADKTAPVMKSSTPKNNATGVSTSTSIKLSIKFSENIYKGKNFSKIKITKSNKSIGLKVYISKNVLTIAHTKALSYSASYVVSVPGSSLKDKAGNVLKKAISIKFKTKAKTPADKVYKIGTDLPAGEYVISGGMDVDYCVTSDLAGKNIIVNIYGDEYTYQTLDAGTYLRLKKGLGTVTPIADAPIYGPIDGKYADGMYKVGRDIPAGNYDLNVGEGGMGVYMIEKDSYNIESSMVDFNFISENEQITLTDGQYILLSNTYINAPVV